MIQISKDLDSTDDMKKYEELTGKKAIWRGEITKGYIKWRDGKKNYYSGKKRISVYIADEVEKKWLDFMKKRKINSLSKLIRKGVKTFIENEEDFTNKDFTKFTHKLKERITIIKGNLQLINELHILSLNDNVISLINDTLNEIKGLEEDFTLSFEKKGTKPANYDLLLIEDNIATVNLIERFFKNKGYSCKSFHTGLSGLEELDLNIPKLILLDIILPDINGFDVCKMIKSNKKFKDVPVIYVTAVIGSKVEERLEETEADGYILKPFNLDDLKFLFQYL